MTSYFIGVDGGTEDLRVGVFDREGVCYGTELISETFRGTGFAPSEVVAGGATRSELWLQLHADVPSLPLTVTRVPDAPLLGSALLAAVGTGHFDDLGSAAEQMVMLERVVEPDAAQHDVYQELFALYKELYPTLSPLLHRQVDLTKRLERPARTRRTPGEEVRMV